MIAAFDMLALLLPIQPVGDIPQHLFKAFHVSLHCLRFKLHDWTARPAVTLPKLTILIFPIGVLVAASPSLRPATVSLAIRDHLLI